MRFFPKLFLLLMLLLAAARWTTESGRQSSGGVFQQSRSPPTSQAADQPGLPERHAAAQLGGKFEFKPSEQISADRGVDFPADI